MPTIKDLQEDLIRYYTEKLADLPIAPLVEEHSVPLEDLYVQPRLAIRRTTEYGQAEQEQDIKYITSLKDVFLDERNKTPYKKIYVTGGAGMGKTAFSRKLALLWCEGKKKNQEKFTTEEIEIMKRFDVMFYLQLQEFQADCDLGNMIGKMAASLSRGYSYTKEKTFLEQVLCNERCLIILDGVDGWVHPKAGCKFSSREEEMPHNQFSNCTVLTTILPWKYKHSGNADRKLEICDLTDRVVQNLEANAIRLLQQISGKKGNGCENETIDKFDDQIHLAKLEEARYKPFILLQFLCMWHDHMPFGNSRFEAYTTIIDVTLKRKGEKIKTLNDEEKKLCSYIPDCISQKSMCRNNFPILFKAGKLAFIQICIDLEQSKIARSETDETGLTHEELKYLCHVGILSQRKDETLVARIQYILSFSHKLIQEYLAALYLVTAWRMRIKRGPVLRRCCQLPDVFKETINRIVYLVRDVDMIMYDDLTKMMKTGERRTSDYVHFIGNKLLALTSHDAEELIEDCTEKTNIRLGQNETKVFKSEKLKDRFSTMTVKRFEARDLTSSKIPIAVRNEMHLSKLKHPFILPTTALVRDVFEGETTYYRISPFCGKGDLRKFLLQKNAKEIMSSGLRILLQVALGIQFLHTPTRGQLSPEAGEMSAEKGELPPTSRGVIVHNKICSENILLDDKGNVRLSNFSMAEDKGLDPHKEVTHEDYKGFAVIVKEVLTGMQKGTSAQSDEDDVIKDLKTIVGACQTVPKKFNFKTNVVDELKKLAKGICENSSDGRCILCMVQTAEVNETIHKDNCQKVHVFQVCIECEKRSFWYPVSCHACGGELKPVIGMNWGALLVAGNDTGDINDAMTFKKDLKSMYKTLTSKAPFIVGIKEKNVKQIAPENPGQPTQLLQELDEAVDQLKDENIDTLIVYVSCHGDNEHKKKTKEGKAKHLEEDGALSDGSVKKKQKLQNTEDSKGTEDEFDNVFILGSPDETLDINGFQERLQKITSRNIRKVILFLDRCYPPQIILPESKKVDKEAKRPTLIQLNSGSASLPSFMENQESLFTKYLIQGLKTDSSKARENATVKRHFVTVSDLHQYIDDYTKEIRYKDPKDNKYHRQRPMLYYPTGVQIDSIRIAYCNTEEREVAFHFDVENKILKQSVDMSVEMNMLKSDLAVLFDKNKQKYDVKIERELSENQFVECKEVGDILLASMIGERVVVNFPLRK